MAITRRIKLKYKVRFKEQQIRRNKMIQIVTSCLFEGTSKEDRSLAWEKRTSVLHAE